MERDTLENLPAADFEIVNRARAFAAERTTRTSYRGYGAAQLLSEQGAEPVLIAGALLAPLVWEGQISIRELETNFGSQIVAIIENLRSPFKPFSGSERSRRKDIHALLESIGRFPSKAILFITFRLLALEAGSDFGKRALHEMARETRELLVPIANRLSLGELRRKLEDACFRVLDPLSYANLKAEVAPIRSEDDRCLRILLTGVRRLLDRKGIPGRVEGRTKSLYGIWRKMERTGSSSRQIMDRIGLRVIVTSVPDCYAVLGMLHSHFKPIPGTFDDYIGLPKDNGYQSLHTCVYPVREVSHKPIEFQVRTELMHAEAEHGTAAHWRYKRETGGANMNRQRTQWMEGLVRQHEEASSNKAFIELLHRQVFHDHLVVFGNGGRIVRLTESATVYDYLKVANIQAWQGVNIKVNGKTAAIDHPLRDGDSIEIQAGGPEGSNSSGERPAEDEPPELFLP